MDPSAPPPKVPDPFAPVAAPPPVNPSLPPEPVPVQQPVPMSPTVQDPFEKPVITQPGFEDIPATPVVQPTLSVAPTAPPTVPTPAISDSRTPTMPLPARNASPSDAGGPPSPIPAPPPKKEMAPPMPTVAVPEVKAPLKEDADKVAAEEGDEYWQLYAKEIEMEKEIAEIGGMEKIESGEVPIPEAIAKEMGVKPAITIETPIAVAKDFNIASVTLTDEQLSTGIKKPTSSGFRWLAEWFIYQLKKAHYLVKSVRGKILRERIAESA